MTTLSTPTENAAVLEYRLTAVDRCDSCGAQAYIAAEVNGSEGSAAYQLTDPNNIQIGLGGEPMHKEPVPDEFLVIPGSPRNPHEGVPSTVFLYDLVNEFVSAIVEGRDAVPGFDHGAKAQAVADAVLESFEQRRWVELQAKLN